MRWRRWTILSSALAVGVTAGMRTPAQTSSLSVAAIDEIDRYLETQRTQAKIPGWTIAIGHRGTVVYSKGSGFADLEHRVPAVPHTAFRTASIAKPMTATAVMTLVESGKIDLDRPVQAYCPAFPRKPWPLTTRQLLGHLSGIRHYKPGESSGTQHHFTLESALELFKNDPLVHEPGTKYLYSTFAYNVLGCVIEGASTSSYESYLRDRVWMPSGMARTRLDRLWDIVPDRARGYQLLTDEGWKSLPPASRLIAKPGEIYNAPLHDTSMKIPGGGLLSTAEDLVRFGMATMSASLVKKETVELMWTEGKTRGGEATGYGLGWGVTPPQDGIRRISHGGNQVGASSGLLVFPEVALSYAIMTNLEDVEFPPITRGLAQILRKHLMTGAAPGR